jgi:hypothetical protein
MYNELDENDSVFMVADVTAEFTARFSGASDTVRWGYYIKADTAGTTFGNVCAKLIITYEYDDTAHDTRIKTVRIPIESLNGRLITASYTEICQDGGAVDQIPALTGGGFLPENTPTVRQAFLELWTNTTPSGTTDGVITLRLDAAGSTQAYTTIDNTQDSGTAIRLMWDITAQDLSISHALYGITTNASMCAQIGGWLTVTYEYVHSSSSTILNSLFMGFGEELLSIGATGDQSKISISRYIEEENVTLVQSGLWVTFQTIATNSAFNLKAGSQVNTGYATVIDGAATGMVSVVQRVDSNAYRGAGIALARGENTWTCEWYSGAALRHANVSAMLILNYTSDKASGGDGVHARSVHFPILPSNRPVGTRITGTASTVPKIIEPNYWLMSCNPMVYASGNCLAADMVGVAAERLATESPAGGWQPLFASIGLGGGENGIVMSNGVCRSEFKRWPSDTDTKRIDVEGSRTWAVGGTSKQYGLGLWITYHSHTYTISGTVSGYVDADGAGLTVSIFRCSDGLYLGDATTTAGGAFTMTWYDNTEDYRAICEEDSTHVGCSIKGKAT